MDFDNYRKLQLLGDRWEQSKDTPERWNLIREAYALILPEIMEGPVSPYFFEWDFTPIERLAWMDIRGRGLRLYPQFPVGRVFIDFADPVRKIGVEIDGAAYHEHAKDLARDTALAQQGWKIFRVKGCDAVKVVQNPFDNQGELEASGEWRNALIEWGMSDSSGFFWALDRIYYKTKFGDRNSALEILARHHIADFDVFEAEE